MSKYVCLECGEIYDTDYIVFEKESDWNFCPKAKCFGNIVKLDDNMIAPIIALNKNNIPTKFCCGGHIGENTCAPYIAFNDDTMDYEDMIILRNAILVYVTAGWKEENFINASINLGENLFSYNNIISQTENNNLSEYITPNKITTSLCLRGNPGYYLLSVFEARTYRDLKRKIYRNYLKLIDFADAFLQRKNGDITASEYIKRELSQFDVNNLLKEIKESYKELNKLEDLMTKKFNEVDYLGQQNSINQLNESLNIIIANIISYIKKERKCLDIIGWEMLMCNPYYGLTMDTKMKIDQRIENSFNCENCIIGCNNCNNCPLSDTEEISKEVEYETLNNFLKYIE